MLKKLKYWIRNYFGFSQLESNGFVVLIFIMAILIFAPFVYNWLLRDTESAHPSDRKKLDSLLALLQKENPQDSLKTSYINYQKTGKDTYNQAALFEFNPNEIGREDWQKLGLKPKIAQNIIKYRNKGGKFKKKEDLLKIYGFPEKLYARLEPYIILADKTEYSENTKKDKYLEGTVKTEKLSIKPFDINQADTSQLKQIAGIGSVLSYRIINYRDKLGGFVAADQIREVYGLKPEVAEELLKYIESDWKTIRKINVNTADIEQLDAHPYISKNIAKTIVNYRKQHGKFTVLEELKKIQSINADLWAKISPYLSL